MALFKVLSKAAIAAALSDTTVSAAVVAQVQSATGELRSDWYATSITHNATGDNTTALNALFAAAATVHGVAVNANRRGRVVIGPGQVNFAGQLVCGPNIDIICEGTLFYNGTKDQLVLDVGSDTVDSTTAHYHIKMRGSVSINATDIANAGTTYIGVQFRNCVDCDFDLRQVQYFCRGAVLVGKGTGKGFQKNKNIRLGSFYGCYQGVVLRGDGSGSFCNENTFTGGDFGTDIATSSAAYAIVTEDANSGSSSGNNHFYEPCFQLGYASSGDRIPVLHGTTGSIFVWRARNEGCGPYGLKITSATAALTSIVEFSYISSLANSVINDVSISGSFIINSYSAGLRNHHSTFESGRIKDRAVEYDGSSGVMIPGLYMHNNYTEVDGFTSSQASAVGENYIQFANSAGVGIGVELSAGIHALTVKRRTTSSRPGRLAMQLYGPNGDLLDNGTVTLLNLVKCREFSLALSSTNRVTQSSDSNVDGTLWFDNTLVSKVKFSFVGGTNPIQLIGFSIHSPEGEPLLPFGGKTLPSATALPAALSRIYYPKGLFIARANPTSASPANYSVSTAGEVAATAWVTSTVYAIGDIRSNASNVYEAVSAGTSGASAPTGTTATTAVPVSDGAVNWRWRAPVAVFKSGPNTA